MRSIKLIDFSSLVECSTQTYSSYESFLPITYEFFSGNIYGLISDFGCGSWGLANSITGKGQLNSTGKIFIDGKLSNVEELSLISGNVLDPIWLNFFDDRAKCTVSNCIEYALRNSQQKYTQNEIKDIFCLSDARYSRLMDAVSGEIWNISLAILFALDKEVIAFPWMNAIDGKRMIFLNEQGVFDFLKKQNKIVLLPSSQKRMVKRISDGFIQFDISAKTANIKYH